jgi:type I restriction enzyme M protein
MLTGTLRNDIDKLWEAFWSGGISNPLTVIEQITYLLFIKRLDELQTRQEKAAQLFGGSPDKAIFQEDEAPLRWSHFINTGPEEIYERFTQGIELEREVDGELKNVRVSVFDFIKNLADAESVFAQNMKGATFMIPNARLLDKAVQMIDKVDMDDRDTKGDVYEYLLSKIASAGQNGQFRTPRHIIRLMVDMVAPKPKDTVCDPSAGTCGFLVATDDYLRENHEDAFYDEAFKEHYKTALYNGVEFDPSMVRIGAMNLMLHGIESPNLVSADALSEENAELKDAYSLILANPPFKGSLDYEAIEPSLLRMVKTKKTELLFLALMLRMLKPGGRAAVIVPDGVLFGSSKAHKAIRREIIEGHQLQAVISMPSGVFKPYAGVSTAILFFVRTDSGGTDQVWFYDMKNDGYSLDDKRQPIEQTDLPDILQRWQNREAESERKRTDRSFLVPFEEIKANDWDLSINRYKEIVYEEMEYDPPHIIINGDPNDPEKKGIRDLDRERAELLDELEKLII